jgi:hypothetical protein
VTVLPLRGWSAPVRSPVGEQWVRGVARGDLIGGDDL